MAIDITARGLASALIGADGKIDSSKLPTVVAPSGAAFTPVGSLTDPSMIEGKTAEEIVMMMLFNIVPPTITNPSFKAKLDQDYLIAYQEQIITGQLMFDRGGIKYSNGTSMPRAGAPVYFEVGDEMIVNSETTVAFSLTLIPTLGENEIKTSVTFEEGPQPVDSAGRPFDVPYPAGSLYAPIKINGISSLVTANDESIDYTFLTLKDGAAYEALLIPEIDDERQSFKLLSATPIVGIKQFNPLSQTWDWIGGSTTASLKTFDTTIIQGTTPEDTYIVYMHNGSLKGSRTLRLYTIIS